jgi:[acyl-carrier-protein] S-malonyltransferase
VANINSPEQIVLSGEVGGVQKAAQLAEAKGAKRAVILKVSGAFHSSLMQEAAERFKVLLTGMTFKAPKGLFLSNVTGDFVSSPDQIKENLGKQVTHSVQWVKTMTNLAAGGHQYFVEADLQLIAEKLTTKQKEIIHAS